MSNPRSRMAVLGTAAIALVTLIAWGAYSTSTRAADPTVSPFGPDSRIQRGFEIAPVPLDLQGKNRAMVGLGSYIVNAVASCNDCHSCPSFAPGHNPYAGGDGKINSANYLAGGVPFGPFTSRNITPDSTGMPAGLTAEEFVSVIRTGHDPDNPGQLLFVMPWPILRNMTDRDLLSVYEYLRSIPHAEPGECGGAGE